MNVVKEMCEAYPLISVIIPAYNHERYVEDCIRSAMAQDWPRMELLVVDDGSKDGTWRKLQELKKECEEHFERVEMRTRANCGASATLSELSGMARGEYVAGIASDDMYLPGAFSALIKPMLADDAVGIVVGQNELMDSEGVHCYWDQDRNIVYSPESARWITFNDYLQEVTGIRENSEEYGQYRSFVRENHIVNGALVRRSCMEKILPFQPDAPLEDHWSHLQYSKFTRYRAVADHTFRYRWHATNTIKQTERMAWYWYKTMKWEERHVQGLPDPQWNRIFQAATRHENIKFRIGNLVKIAKVRTLDYYRKELVIFGRVFILKEYDSPVPAQWRGERD